MSVDGAIVVAVYLGVSVDSTVGVYVCVSVGTVVAVYLYVSVVGIGVVVVLGWNVAVEYLCDPTNGVVVVVSGVVYLSVSDTVVGVTL